MTEQWDDYHLRSVAISGNKELYEHLGEYQIERNDIESKYTHEAVLWYSGRHIAMMDDQLDYYQLQKPAKDIQEEVSLLSKNVQESFKSLGNTVKSLPGTIKDMGIGEKFKSLFAKKDVQKTPEPVDEEIAEVYRDIQPA